MPAEEVHSKRILNLLDKKGVEIVTAMKLETLMEEIEWKLYAPQQESTGAAEVYTRAQEVLQELQTRVNKG